MPGAPGFGLSDSRERALGIAGALAVQLALALALLSGLRVDVTRAREVVAKLIEVPLQPPPPIPQVRPVTEKRRPEAAASRLAQQGESGHTRPATLPLLLAPTVAHAAPVLGAAGKGVATTAGSGAGSGGSGEGAGDGDGEGGTDLVQIAGAIGPSDYPRNLRDAGIGGRVGVLFDVGVNGRVMHCTVTRSSGVAELDALTCRLIQERFRYRPSTDERGRPIPDQVEGEHDWVAGRRY